MKTISQTFATFVLLFMCLPSMGQSDPGSDGSWRGELATKKPTEMTKEELRAYRQAVEARAKELGIVQDVPGYKPLSPAEKTNQEPMPKRVPGTSIQYDSGVVTGFHTAVASGRMVGNRYDTAIGDSGTMCCFPVENSGTISMVTFNMLRTSGMSVTISLYSNIMGTSALMVTSMAIPAVVGLNTHTLGTMTNGQYANGSFLAGIFQFNTAFTRIGVDTGTTGGQGFHAITINDNTTMGARNTGVSLMNVPNLNVVFRLGGNLATPVELMNFEVE